MNMYDQAHLRLLTIISKRQWQALCEEDLPVINVLRVCKYILAGNPAIGQPQLILSPEGLLYQERLEGLRSLVVDERHVQRIEQSL